MVEEEQQVVAPVVPPLLIPEPRPIGLKNGLAVRIALLSCAISTVLSMLTGALGVPPLISMAWFVGAGFFAVSLYRIRTGTNLSTVSGATLGWISGLFLFVPVFISSVAQLSGPDGLDKLREALKAQQRSEAEVSQVIEILRSPAGMIMGVIIVFLFVTSLPAFGGAICAKFFARREQ